MADLQKLIHGEPNWDAKVNKIIDALSQMSSNMLSLSMSNKSDLGVVGLNGANIANNPGLFNRVFYQYVQLKNTKLVTLYVFADGVDVGDNIYTIDIAQVPDIIRPNVKVHSLEPANASTKTAASMMDVSLSENGTVTASSSFAINRSVGMFGTFVYLTSH